MPNSMKIFKHFFEPRAVKISLFISGLFYLCLLTLAYFEEIKKIDKTSISKFGEKISSQMTFTEILASADIGYITSTLKVLVAIFIPTIALVHLARKNIIQEMHPGWRRLNIVTPTILAIGLIIIFNFPNLLDIIFISITSSLVALSATSITRWVLAGFRKT